MSGALESYPGLVSLGVVCAGGVAVTAFLRRPMWGLYAFLVLSAVLIAPELPVVGEKLSVADPVFALAAACLLVSGRRLRATPVPLLRAQKHALGLVTLWWLLATVSLLTNVARGAVGPAYQVQCLLELAVYLYGILSLAVVVRYVDTWPRWVAALTAYAVGGAVVSVVGWAGLLPGAPAWMMDEYSGRVSSTLRESGQVAGYVGPLLVYSLFLHQQWAAPRWARSRAGLAAGVVAVLSGFGVNVLSGSRMSLLVNAVAFAALAALVVRENRRTGTKTGRVKFVLATGLVAGVTVAGMAAAAPEQRTGPVPPWARAVQIFQAWWEGEAEVDDPRVRQLKIASGTFLDYPIVGVGAGNWKFFYGTHEPHNTYVAVAAEGGAVAAAAFLLFLLVLGGIGLRASARCPAGPPRALVRAFLVGFGVLLFYQLTILGLRQRHFWFLCGLMICLPRVIADLRLRLQAAREAARAGDPPPQGAAA